MKRTRKEGAADVKKTRGPRRVWTKPEHASRETKKSDSLERVRRAGGGARAGSGLARRKKNTPKSKKNKKELKLAPGKQERDRNTARDREKPTNISRSWALSFHCPGGSYRPSSLLHTRFPTEFGKKKEIERRKTATLTYSVAFLSVLSEMYVRVSVKGLILPLFVFRTPEYRHALATFLRLRLELF